jgi:hypothetical protein
MCHTEIALSDALVIDMTSCAGKQKHHEGKGAIK